MARLSIMSASAKGSPAHRVGRILFYFLLAVLAAALVTGLRSLSG